MVKLGVFGMPNHSFNKKITQYKNMKAELTKINRISRYGLAFVFFYHGLVPKIIWLSPIETQLVLAHHIDVSTAIISTVGGIFEILLAGTIIFFTQSLIPIYIAAVLLATLLIDVCFVMPELLIAAFNPISINIATLVLCYVVYLSQEGEFNLDKRR